MSGPDPHVTLLSGDLKADLLAADLERARAVNEGLRAARDESRRAARERMGLGERLR